MENKNLETEKKVEITREDSLDFLNDNQKSKYAKYFFAKCRTKKEIQPHFEMSRQIDGVIQRVDFKQPIQRISGKLNNIQFSQGEYQGQVIKSVIFKMETLNPSNEMFGFRISCSRNNALLNWLNCLIGTNTEITAFEISLWKDRNTGFNKSTCRINGKKPSWAYTLEQMEEKKEKITDKKGNLLMTKTDELFDFMEDELNKKLDVLLPNRYKEDESDRFESAFVPTDGDPVGEDNANEFNPEFEEDENNKAINEFFDGKKK
jgi:hypothetical protein